MKLIGLTGGIATGKSSVSRHLRALGVPVIDCDELARKVVEPGTPAHAQLVAAFGEGILLDPQHGDRRLDRAKLGRVVFSDPSARSTLNGITHPAIRRAIMADVVECWLRGKRMVVVDAPLLIEAGLHRFMAEVVVVYCPEDAQLARLRERDGLSEADARARMAAQAPMADKLRLATRVLDNSGSLDALLAQVDELVTRIDPPTWWVWAWRIGPLAIVLAVVAPLLWYSALGIFRVGAFAYHWGTASMSKALTPP